MSLAKASVWTAGSTLIKIGAGLNIIKLLAVSFGPSGLGIAGNFRQLITVLGVLSGAGIFNGVTKLVAEHHENKQQLRHVLGTSSSFILLSSGLLAALFLLFSSQISAILFGHTRYHIVVSALALVQMGIAYANYFLAIVKGYRDAKGNALATIAGSFVGVIAYYFSVLCAGYDGALLGLGLVPALIVLPASVLIWRRKWFSLVMLKPMWNGVIASQLGKFTIMALLTATTLPVAYILMRNLLAKQYSWDEVGLWQGMTSISDAYLQFITAAFTVYLLPSLSRLQDKHAIKAEILRSLKFVLPLVACVSFTVWLLRDFAIWLLFSNQFTRMRELFAWQLVGDILKVSAYVFGYLVIAKAALRFYLLTEISQFVLLTGFAYWLIPNAGAIGAAQAYMVAYIVYFALCCSAFVIYCRRI